MQSFIKALLTRSSVVMLTLGISAGVTAGCDSEPGTKSSRSYYGLGDEDEHGPQRLSLRLLGDACNESVV
ncbi:MAG: hypothetical protein ACPG77_06310 [Nannocystaceae bacterium]